MKYLFIMIGVALVTFGVTRTTNVKISNEIQNSVTESENILCDYEEENTFEDFEEDPEFLEFKAEIERKLEEVVMNGLIKEEGK